MWPILKTVSDIRLSQMPSVTDIGVKHRARLVIVFMCIIVPWVLVCLVPAREHKIYYILSVYFELLAPKQIYGCN